MKSETVEIVINKQEKLTTTKLVATALNGKEAQMYLDIMILTGHWMEIRYGDE